MGGGGFLAPVLDALISDGRSVLAREYEYLPVGGARELPLSWLRFDREGRVTGQFTVSPDVEIQSIQGDLLGAVSLDSLGVESVLLLRIQPGGE